MKSFKIILKLFFAFLLSLIVLFSVTIFVFVGLLFFDPTIIINPKNINYALSKTHFLKSWSWTSAEIQHHWIKWNHRQFQGAFKNLCLEYQRPGKEINTCMETVAWNLDLIWNYGSGFSYHIKNPLVIDSKKTKIVIHSDEQKKAETTPDYFSYWKILWSKAIPDVDFNFRSVDLIKDYELKHFDLWLIKNQKTLRAKALDFEIFATPEKVEVTAPHKILLPYDLKTKKPLYFKEIKLTALIEENTIPLTLAGKIETAKLVVTSSIAKSALRQNMPLNQLIKNVLLKTEASLEIDKLVETIRKLMKAPFNILPAPFNVLEGSLKVRLATKDMGAGDQVMIKIVSALDLSGASQFVVLDLSSDFPFLINSKTIGPLTLGLDFKKVVIALPKLSKTKLPPQLKPDPRFIGVKIVAENKNASQKKKLKPKKNVGVDLNIEALGEKSLQIRTNLLDEVLKLNFQMEIANKTIRTGFIQTMPLRTKVFKRQLFIPSLRIIFKAPVEPQIISTIEFHLPEYLVTLKLAGPVSRPRTAFSSKPPLPKDDIIAVLLFGRPLSALGPEDKTVTKDAGQIISQGILSLAVLYYFAGSPVESIGYDPDTKVVSAQFGLGRKNSLHVESGGSGGSTVGSYGVRHALGKGWYIDSTVEQNSSTGSTGKNLGVLLERIIAY